MRLFILQAGHLVIVILSIASIFYTLYCGLAGGGGLILAAAVLWPGLIGAARYLNGVECILQTWARQMQNIPKGQWARDILWVPESWAVRIPAVFTPLYLLGAGLVLGRALERGAWP